MREVEAKYQVQDVEALVVALKIRGVELSPPIQQDDQTYAPTGWQPGDSKLGVPFAHLRTASGLHTFSLARAADNARAHEEHETEIIDRGQMHHAVVAMGYRPTARVIKTRRTAAFDDMFLCVDDVEGLGTFLEVERAVPEHASSEATQAELVGFVASLGAVGLVEAD